RLGGVRPHLKQAVQVGPVEHERLPRDAPPVRGELLGAELEDGGPRRRARGAEAVVEHGAGEVAPRRGEEVVDARRADPRVRRGDGGARALRQAVGGRVGPAVGTIRLRPPPLVLLLAMLLLLLSLPLSEGLSGGAP
ncbi:hypothetical protein EG865_15460, partial [Enterococcus faecalis]